MTKILYILILFSFSRQVLGQIFKQYKKTEFYFVSANKKLKGRITSNAYIQKGDTILILPNKDLNSFLTLFEKTPSTFDSLFKNLPWIGNKGSSSDKFDKVLGLTKYKVHSEIGIVSVMKMVMKLFGI